MKEEDIKEIKGEHPEAEIRNLAERVLKVYGKVETPTLDREIRRMAEILNIPTREVLSHG
jgi:hypothetical protein